MTIGEIARLALALWFAPSKLVQRRMLSMKLDEMRAQNRQRSAWESLRKDLDWRNSNVEMMTGAASRR